MSTAWEHVSVCVWLAIGLYPAIKQQMNLTWDFKFSQADGTFKYSGSLLDSSCKIFKMQFICLPNQWVCWFQSYKRFIK